jgi:L-amino acid N-acyltransferase YncA
MRINFLGSVAEIDSLPGCSQVAVSHSAFTQPGLRGRGRGRMGNKTRLDYMKTLGYDYALCTIDVANEAQVSILKKNGWSRLDSFVSSKTGHDVALFGKGLK